MKKIIRFIVILIAIFTISSCTNNLNAPILALNNGVLKWNEINGATNYIVNINDEEYATTNTKYDLTTLEGTKFVCKVKAQNGKNESLYSNEVIYNGTNNVSNKLSTPTISIKDNIISWNMIENATSYEVYVNESLATTTTDLSYTIPSAAEGTYNFYIIAITDITGYQSSDISNVLVYKKIMDIMTISEIKTLIDKNPRSQTKVKFKGEVIGFDSNGYAHVADETGAIYVRAYHSLLKLGNTVTISGYGYVYFGRNNPEYTRQISNENIEISLSEEKVDWNHITVLTKEELWSYDMSNLTKASFMGNLVTITGIVEAGDNPYSFYLKDQIGQIICGIHHYSTNFNNSMDEETNIFLKLDQQEVTITGIIYRYYIYDELWTLQCIGLENEVISDTSLLPTPRISKSNNTLLISSDFSNATYAIYDEDELLMEITNNSIDLSNLLSSGTHEIKVKMIKSGLENEQREESNFSNSLTFIIGGKTEVVNIFMINDSHGSFVDGQTPGMEKIASALKDLSEQNGEYLKIANGDIFQGSYVSSILYGKPMIDALNEMKFDAFVLGNHEFDWGLDEIAKYKDGNLENGEANFPFVCANIIDKRTNELVSWLEPYTTVTIGDVKVGVIGLIGYELESSILTENVKNYDFVYPLEIVKKYAKELRTIEQCDCVIISIHDYDEDLNKEFASLIDDERIDAILCGHTHQNIYQNATRKDSAKIAIVQNKDKNRSAIDMQLTFENNVLTNSKVNRIDPSKYEKDNDMTTVIEKYQSVIDYGNSVVCNLPYYASKSVLGAYATSSMKNAYQTDIAIMNTGGVRATISSGNVTVADIFEVFPFNNKVILIEMSGKEIKSLYEENSNYLYFNEEFYEITLNDTQKYSVAVIDYVYTSTRYYQFKNTTPNNTETILRDVVVDYLKDLFKELIYA